MKWILKTFLVAFILVSSMVVNVHSLPRPDPKMFTYRMIIQFKDDTPSRDIEDYLNEIKDKGFVVMNSMKYLGNMCVVSVPLDLLKTAKIELQSHIIKTIEDDIEVRIMPITNNHWNNYI